MPKDCNVTTIVYRDGELASDSKIARHMDTACQRFITGEKVYKTPCGRAYVAKPGEMYDAEGMAAISQEILLQILVMLEKNVTPHHFEGLKHVKQEFLVVTRDEAYHIEYGVISKLEAGDFCIMGSGIYIARAPILFGMTPTEAVMFTLDRDRLSGGPVRTYMASKLKPLMVEVKTPRKRVARAAK